MLRKKSWSAEHIAVLAAHLRAARISQVRVYSPGRDLPVFENTLLSGGISVLGRGYSVRKLQRDKSMSDLNVVVTKRVNPKQARSLVRACFDTDCPPQYVTLCVVLPDLGMTRDEVVAQCISHEERFGGRADILGMRSEGIWITFFSRAPTVFLSLGPTRSGKSTVADLLNSYRLTRVSGDSVLELISNGSITVSPRLSDVCARGLASDNWGTSISLINEDDHLREEFARLLASRSNNSSVIDLWMPTELKESVVSAFASRGFRVFSIMEERNLSPHAESLRLISPERL